MIEVNLHPAASGRSWRATPPSSPRGGTAQCRLGARRSSYARRRTPAPAGQPHRHGRGDPSDSPFCAATSTLLGYWHNHPSLSYLFSGMFIGPTSQHPRVDEATATPVRAGARLQQIPESGKKVEPWIIDRICATCWWTSPATRTARVQHRQALYAQNSS
ncbi:MAG: transglutaminase family protein [Kiritimatiellia bacterium]